MKFEDIKVVFIVGANKKDNFTEWLVELGLHWFAKDWEALKKELREKDMLLIEDDSPKLKSLINDLNESTGKVIWFIGCNKVISYLNPFGHYFFNTKQEWNLFKTQRKESYEQLIRINGEL